MDTDYCLSVLTEIGYIVCFYNVSVVCLVTKRLKSREFVSNGPFAVLKKLTPKRSIFTVTLILNYPLVVILKQFNFHFI